MSVILRGNGQDTVRINGRAVSYQGAGHLRQDVSTEAALQKVKNNGLDEIFLNVRLENGKTERVVLYGDTLDLTFMRVSKTPQVTVNGKVATLVGFDHEPTTLAEGALQGAKQGLADAFDTLSRLAQSFLTSLVGGGLAVIGGGALLSLLATTTGAGATLGAALGAIAAPVTTASLGLAALAFVLIAVNGAVKGAMAAVQSQPKMDTIAGILEEAMALPAPRIDDPSGRTGEPFPIVTPDPVRIDTPSPVRREGRSTPAPEPVEPGRPRFRRFA
ncbi:MAG: hypothetical protein VKP72_04430 [bacterium]|nr:hypothetical protein [bacterium]